MERTESDDADDSGDGPWLTLYLDDGVHVLPLQEVMRHELDRGCWCGVWVETANPKTGAAYDIEIVGHTVIGEGVIDIGHVLDRATIERWMKQD